MLTPLTHARSRVATDPGRTVGLTARVQQIVCDAIAAGNYFSVAADAAGISKSTLEKWRRRGARGEQPFADFVKAIHQAELDWEVSAVKAIQSAGEKDWRAHLELLSRRIPERWARANREMNPVSGVQAFQINIHMSDPETQK